VPSRTLGPLGLAPRTIWTGEHEYIAGSTSLPQSFGCSPEGSARLPLPALAGSGKDPAALGLDSASPP
jgi:hypothetical protein